MEIYIDIIIIENFIINLFILFVVGKLLRLKVRKPYIYIAAIIGGFYTIVMFTEIKWLYSIPFKLFMVFIMSKVAFEISDFKVLFKSVLTFLLSSFMISGLCFGLSISQNEYIIGEVFYMSDYSIKITLLAVMLIYIITVRINEYIIDRGKIENLVYDICINKNGSELFLKGFLDTGNELREPVSNLPCMIVSKEYFNDMELKNDNGYKIAYNTIDNIGILYGYKFKDIKIRDKSSMKWNNIEAIVCLSNKEINIENQYQVLLSRGVI